VEWSNRQNDGLRKDYEEEHELRKAATSELTDLRAKAYPLTKQEVLDKGNQFSEQFNDIVAFSKKQAQEIG